jgi:hypothetical protein
MELDALLNRFRIASRELFNHFFRVDDPYNNEEAWALEESYGEVETLLFEKLVLEPGRQGAQLRYVGHLRTARMALTMCSHGATVAS